jgi:hypothetical protein
VVVIERGASGDLLNAHRSVGDLHVAADHRA